MRFLIFGILLTVIPKYGLMTDDGSADDFDQNLKKAQEQEQKLSQLTEQAKLLLILGLQNRLEQETGLRRMLQSLIDFGELIEGLFEQCYPKWAGVRIPKTYSKDDWQNLLLNIEHPRILFLKKGLKNAGVSEETFIEIMNNFLRIRNQEAHYLMKPKEREEAYTELLKTKTNAEKVVLRLILNYSYPVTDDDKVILIDTPSTITTTADGTAHESTKRLIQDTIKQREFIKLMKLPRFCFPNSNDEEFLENAFIKFIQKLNEKYGSNIETRAFLVDGTLGAFILFDSFKSANETFKRIKTSPEEIELHPEQLEEMMLISVERNVLCNAVGILMITSTNTIESDTVQDIKTWDFNIVVNEMKKTSNVAIQRCLTTNDGDTVYFAYESFESILIAYQKAKEVLRSQKMAGKVSIVNASYVNTDKLILCS